MFTSRSAREEILFSTAALQQADDVLLAAAITAANLSRAQLSASTRSLPARGRGLPLFQSSTQTDETRRVTQISRMRAPRSLARYCFTIPTFQFPNPIPKFIRQDERMESGEKRENQSMADRPNVVVNDGYTVNRTHVCTRSSHSLSLLA